VGGGGRRKAATVVVVVVCRRSLYKGLGCGAEGGLGSWNVMQGIVFRIER